MGRQNIISSVFNFDSSKETEARFSDKTVNELVKAVFEMAKVKTGALIVIEKKTPLNEYERTGITLDSVITSQLLINIFEKNTPLTIVVSEETGAVSVAMEGDIKRNLTQDDLRAQLVAAQDKAQDTGRFRLWKGRVKKHEENADK